MRVLFLSSSSFSCQFSYGLYIFVFVCSRMCTLFKDGFEEIYKNSSISAGQVGVRVEVVRLEY